MIKYYKLYALLIPYLIFWVGYTSYLLLFIYYLLWLRDFTLYFPEDTEWAFVNFLWILPKRLAFNSIYFAKGLNWESLLWLAYYVSILLIVGIPFIFIRIFWIFLKKSDVDDVWDDVSPFENLKLLIRDGRLTRNMKRSLVEGGKVYSEVLNNNHLLKQGLLSVKKGTHAVSFGEGFGVTYTTKEQVDKEALISNYGGSYAYVQGVGNNKILPKNDILNKELSNILKTRGVIEAIYAHSHLLKLSKIVSNHEHMQSYECLSESDLKRSKDFLSKCGGIEKVRQAFEYNNEMNWLLVSARKMLYIMSNSSKSSMWEEYLKNKSVYDIIVGLEKAGNLDGDSELVKIKFKIEKMIDGLI